MSTKEKFRIFIEGKDGRLKKLDATTTVAQLRELFIKEINDEYYFVGEDNCKIEKNEENDFTLKDIATNENKIYIKKNKNEENIFIFLDETKIEEVKCSSEINLDELRKLSKEMNDNLMFIDKDGLEIDIQDENDFKVKEILIDGKINIKKKNSDNNDNNKDNNKNNNENICNVDEINNLNIPKKDVEKENNNKNKVQEKRRVLFETEIRDKIKEYKKERYQPFIKMLEREKINEENRNKKLENIIDEKEKKKLENQFGKERTLVSLRLKKENDKILLDIQNFENKLREENEKNQKYNMDKMNI